MERGVKVLVRIFVGAMLLGALVVVLHEDYRETFRAILRGDVESSPLWRSNAEYYSEVSFEVE
jgi:hypothetical protein